MLTDSERLWLNHRDTAHSDGDYFCEHCDVFAECHMNWPIECPTELSIKLEDIAFETRVAAKLAKGIPQSAWLAEAEKCDMPPSWSRMKLARLQVEEEMNAET